MGMRSNRVQLAWPFAIFGAAVGSQLPAGAAGGVMLALSLAFLGALISSALERVRDWQVAMMAPLVGALIGASFAFLADGIEASAIGTIAGIGFGLLALPPLVLITDAARRASRMPPRSILGRAQRRRLWLLTLAASALVALIVPALANPWAKPAESMLAQLYAVGTMLVAVADSTLWISAAAPRARSITSAAQHPYREPAASPAPLPDVRERVVATLAAEALLYDALLVAVVAAALLVSA